MKSPFPGMDPYLEQHWRNVHHRLITYASDQLHPTCRATFGRELKSECSSNRRKVISTRFIPRCTWWSIPKQKADEGQPAEGAAIAVAEPILVHVDREPSSQGYIEIVDAEFRQPRCHGHRVRESHEQIARRRPEALPKKQKEVIAAGASLVEIDLIARASDCWPDRRNCFTAGNGQPTWRASRGMEAGCGRALSAALAAPLPALRIPLRQSDADVTLNLQPLIDQCYENGGYDISTTVSRRSRPSDPDGAVGRKMAPCQGRADVTAVIEAQGQQQLESPEFVCS